MNRPNPSRPDTSEPSYQQGQGGQYDKDTNRAEKQNPARQDNVKDASDAPRSKNPGRFDNDPERARIAGRKGGENPNNAGRFDNNPARAREAGQKGGQSSQAARHAAAKSSSSSSSSNPPA